MTGIPKVLVWIGALVLAATAAFHGSGYREVTGAAAAAHLEGMLGRVIGGLWLYPSVHWLFLAVLAVVVASSRSRATAIVLRLIAVVLAVDAILLLVYAGPFIGEALLAFSSLVFAAGSLPARNP